MHAADILEVAVLLKEVGLLRPREGHIRFNGLPVFDSRVGIDLPASARKVGSGSIATTSVTVCG